MIGLKKNLDYSVKEKRQLVDFDHAQIPVSRQCQLLGISRSGIYYNSVRDDTFNEHLMRRIDKIFTECPYYGVLRVTACLRREGYAVNEKRIRRLMHLMGLKAIYPKPRTSKAVAEHKKYPYLLGNIDIERPNQVWCTDITYIPMRKGFIYLVAIMDWFSRYVLSWDISITMEVDFCLAALEKALSKGIPEIFNSDQGSQFTSNAFTGKLLQEEIRISMDGRGRAFDNIFIERLWRSVKYEEVYLKDYIDARDARRNIGKYFDRYNHERPHQSLNYITPAEMHYKQALN